MNKEIVPVLHYDIESYSECDLKSAGVYKYAEHPSTELLCLGYRFDQSLVTVWVPRDSLPQEIIDGFNARMKGRARLLVQRAVPREIEQHIRSMGETRAHNHQFERVVMNGVAGQKLGFPRVEIEQTVCVAAKAAAAGLPRALEDAAKALGTHSKDDTGRISMLQVTKPKRATKKDPSTRYTPENAPEKFIDLYCYNADDVYAECGVDEAVPDLPEYEQQVYFLDQRINERGVAVDLPGVHTVKELIAEYKDFLERSMEKATRPAPGPAADPLLLVAEDKPGLKPTQREKIADWVRANGWPNLLDMQAATIKELVERDDVPDNVKHVLRIYSTYNAKAVTKFDAMLEAVCEDGRLRGMFMYHGAGTGRWSSLIIQLQNLFRPVIDDPETAIEAFKSKNLEWIKMLYPKTDPMKVFASTVRGHLVAPKGRKLVCLDYAGVESRMNAFLWNEEWKLKAFREFDAGRGPDQYKIAFANVFNVDPWSVTKPQRQWGKVIDLFGQYEGGVGAFVNLADQYGVNLEELAAAVWPVLPEDVKESAAWMWSKFGRGNSAGLSERTFMACDGAKQLWRRSHPRTVEGWKELKNAAELAVQFPGNTYSVANGKGMFRVVEGPKGHTWLCFLLPSRQRMIRYFKPEWTPPKTIVVVEENPITGAKEEVERTVPGELHYMGVDTNTRRWMRTSTYGGALNNNFVQGACADLLRNGMFELEAGGYPIVLTVHDENGAEVDEAFGSVEEAAALMCREKPWFAGLPLVAEGFEGRRYRK